MSNVSFSNYPLILATRGTKKEVEKTEDRRQMKQLLIKSFCGGPGGGFYKKSPLAAGGKN
jgi:hypothetical protein